MRTSLWHTVTRPRIGAKITAVGLIAVVGAATLAVFMLAHYERSLRRERRELTRQLTETGHAIVADFAARAASGAMPVEEAQTRAKDAVRAIRYADKNYLWISDREARVVAHPMKPEWEGKDKSDVTDVNGKRLYVEFARAVKDSGASYIDYHFPRPGAEQPSPKLAYLQLVPEWGWIVGTGVYVDDVEAAVAAVRRASLVALAVVLLVVSVAVAALARHLRRGIREVAAAARAVSQGDVEQTISYRSHDEIGELADSMRATIGYVSEVANAVDALAAGDTSATVTPRSERDRLSRNVQDAIARIRDLLAETGQLCAAAQDGRLSARGDASRYRGAYGQLVSGLNALLGAAAAPLRDATDVLARVAARELTARMTGEYPGEYARIRDAINDAVANLDDALRQVAASAAQVSSAADQISAGSQSLASGSSEQASSLEEVASSLAELASMAQQSAGNAQEATTLASEAERAVTDGVTQMTRLSEAITNIKESSDQTSRIVRTIDEIAFQTNLLALNAAVEAARAGDAGRGFAVVAEEVRALALRSAEAARNTSALIEASSAHAENGVRLNEGVVTGLQGIQLQVGRVREVMAEMAAANAQQRDGVAQINVAVEQMNGVTQAVAANAEEAAAAAEELNGQAATLTSMVGGFAISPVRSADALPRVETIAAASGVGGRRRRGQPAVAAGRRGRG